MKAEFLKKKFIFVILSLFFSNILIGCSINTSKTDSYNEENSSLSQSEKKEVNPNDKNNTSKKPAKVMSKVKLYEGTYFDDRRFGDNILETFCQVVVSNVTDTSFDFTIYELDGKTEEKKVIFLTNTALFTGDGIEAAFYGKDYTLQFTFPDDRGAYPVAIEIKISGFEPLEGKTYVNNGIPGHEFS